jgi:hypothetical protein
MKYLHINNGQLVSRSGKTQRVVRIWGKCELSSTVAKIRSVEEDEGVKETKIRKGCNSG